MLGQVPNPIEATGCAVLVAGVALGQLRGRRRGPAPVVPGPAAEAAEHTDESLDAVAGRG